MKLSTGVLAGIMSALVLAGCATNDEVVAERDRVVAEKAKENERLRKQLADAESTQLVINKQLQQKEDEAVRLANENRRLAELRLASESEATKAKTPERTAPAVRVNDPNIEIESRKDGSVSLRLLGSSFAPGEADLTPQGQKLLDKVAEELKRHPEFKISVEGHTDDTPLKKTAARWKNNENLSLARAIAVRTYLSVRGKIPDSRMRVVGYGDKHPIDPTKTEAARARNRRVEVVLYN